ncbi:hypothetical protein N9893_02960 [bacterium]|nr:hypothetical protein [bacterium]
MALVEYKLTDEEILKLNKLREDNHTVDKDGFWTPTNYLPIAIADFWKTMAAKRGFHHTTIVPGTSGAMYYKAEPMV